MKSREQQIEDLIADCIVSNNLNIIIQLILQFEKDYKELAKLSTLGAYEDKWTHQDVLDYVTKEI